MGVEMEKAMKLSLEMQHPSYYSDALQQIVLLSIGHYEHPNYHYQVGADIAEYIEERRRASPNPDSILSSSVVERFDIMEAGFGIRCYDAEFDSAWEKSQKTGRMLVISPEVHNYLLDRQNRHRIEEGLPPLTPDRYEDCIEVDEKQEN